MPCVHCQVSASETLDGKHVAFYFSSQAVEDQLEKAAQGQETVRPTPVVKEVRKHVLRMSLFAVVVVVQLNLYLRRRPILYCNRSVVRVLTQQQCALSPASDHDYGRSWSFTSVAKVLNKLH